MTAKLALLLVGLSAAPLVAQAPADSVALEVRTREIASQLRCVICQGLSIEDSPSELAQSMRAIVKDQVAEGRTEAEIKAWFVERYGERILLSPRASGFNLSVYILPVLAFLAGGAGIFVLVRRWSRPGPPNSPGGADDPGVTEDPDLAAWDDLVPRN